VTSEINADIVREWLQALHTQYQLHGDYLVSPRDSNDSPTLEQLSKIRKAHLSIIPILNAYLQQDTELNQLRAEREGLVQWVEKEIAACLPCLPNHRLDDLQDFKSHLTRTAQIEGV